LKSPESLFIVDASFVDLVFIATKRTLTKTRTKEQGILKHPSTSNQERKRENEGKQLTQLHLSLAWDQLGEE
jgi:hypothetical protein